MAGRLVTRYESRVLLPDLLQGYFWLYYNAVDIFLFQIRGEFSVFKKQGIAFADQKGGHHRVV